MNRTFDFGCRYDEICQRTSMNKEFYDYRNSALQRLKRIREDEALISDAHEKQRLNYAVPSFILYRVFISIIWNSTMNHCVPLILLHPMCCREIQHSGCTMNI